jgi:ornithine decarboxylase
MNQTHSRFEIVTQGFNEENGESNTYQVGKHRAIVLSENSNLWDRKDISHPARELRTVMADILSGDPDQSICFLNEGTLREKVSVLQENFLPALQERRIIYAMKANPHPQIMGILEDAGLDGFDCASINEINRAIGTPGMKPSEVYFNNPTKSKAAIRSALIEGVRYFTAQSRSGIQNVLECHREMGEPETEIAIRTETQNDRAAINLSEKFGSTAEEALTLLGMVKDSGLSAGLSMHTGSQNTDLKSFVSGIQFLSQLAKNAGGVSSMNIGGGIPVRLNRASNHNLSDYLQVISRAVEKSLPDIFNENGSIEPRLILEPGRALVAEAVDLVIPVLEIHQRRNENRIFMADGIFTSFSDSAIHNWKYHFGVFPKDGRKLSEHTEKFRLFGQTCDSGDDLGEITFPSDIREGDFLWVKNAGAYMDSQASNFNAFEPPQYVFYNQVRH